MIQRKFKLLAAVGVLTFLTGVTAPPVSKTTFTFRIPGEPETLDWNKAHTMIETYLLMNLMEGLVTFDTNFKVAPAIADSWTISQDGKTYTFKLKKNVKWSDGVGLKAKDFVYSWKRLLTPTTAASYAYFLFDIEGAEEYNRGSNKDFTKVGIKAVDDYTFQIKLKTPIAHWISIPTFWVTFPLREDIVEKYGSVWDAPGRMVTVGPFTLNAHDIDSKIVLKANPYYYGKRGNIEEVVGLIVKDDSTALTLYESGRLDFLTDISTLDLKRLSGRTDLKSFPYLKTGYIGFVTNKFPLSNVMVRRAIAMSIDKSKLGNLLHGGQEAASSFVPPKIMAHIPSMGLKYDPAEAKKVLRGSGLDLTRPLRIELVLPHWDKAMTVAQFIQEQLKTNLGMEVVLQPFDHKTFRKQLDLHAYGMFEASWSADFPDPDNFLSVFQSTAGNNRTTWGNKTFDELILEARKLKDQKLREKKYAQAQKILIEDEAVMIPLYYEPNMALVKGRVQGLELNPINYLLLRKVTLN